MLLYGLIRPIHTSIYRLYRFAIMFYFGGRLCLFSYQGERMNKYRALYIKDNKQYKTYVLAKNEVMAINRLFDTSYRDFRAFDHHALISISLLQKGA